MSAITTHILDIAMGKPANGVPIVLEVFAATETWRELGRGVTDADGRVTNLISVDTKLEPGRYRLTFATAAYFDAQQVKSFYPEVVITFVINDAAQHYHVPLLLSPFGFSTYRGS